MANLVIRPVLVSDAPDVHRIQTQASVLPYILSLPSSRVDQFEERYRKLGAQQHEFVAVLDGTVVGSGGLVQMSGRRSHCGGLYLAVDESVHGQGIGTALLTKLIDLADNWLLLERLELGVLASNPRAQALYERLGFIVEGRKQGAIVSQGKFVDEVIMVRLRPDGRLGDHGPSVVS